MFYNDVVTKIYANFLRNCEIIIVFVAFIVKQDSLFSWQML